MDILDISKYQPLTVATAFVIVISFLLALGHFLPNILSSLKNLWSMCSFINKKANESKIIKIAVDENKKNTLELNDKLDKLTNCLNEFIIESRSSDKKLGEDIALISNRIDQDEIDRIRSRILQFANDLKTQPNKKHSIEEYQHIISQNEKYHQILEPKGLKNGVIDVEFNFILEKYHDVCNNSAEINNDNK